MDGFLEMVTGFSFSIHPEFCSSPAFDALFRKMDAFIAITAPKEKQSGLKITPE
jgi:hypothetical protein